MADLEAELARFEAEIAASGQPSTSYANTGSYTAAAAPSHAAVPPHAAVPSHYGAGLPPPPAMPAGYPPPLAAYAMQSAYPHASAYPGAMPQPSYAPPSYGQPSAANVAVAAAILSAPPVMASQPVFGDSRPNAEQLAKIKEELEAQRTKDNAKAPKKKGIKRHAGKETWFDATLDEWPENDFRIFVGDLGNETNDEVLTKAFQHYSSFNKAKVIRDKRTNKTKGYGFASFSDPVEGARVLKEMQGKYIGNRPCKLRKSDWDTRNAPVSKKQKNSGNPKNKQKPKSVLHK